jgi:hypothetical protein
LKSVSERGSHFAPTISNILATWVSGIRSCDFGCACRTRANTHYRSHTVRSVCPSGWPNRCRILCTSREKLVTPFGMNHLNFPQYNVVLGTLDCLINGHTNTVTPGESYLNLLTTHSETFWLCRRTITIFRGEDACLIELRFIKVHLSSDRPHNFWIDI